MNCKPEEAIYIYNNMLYIYTIYTYIHTASKIFEKHMGCNKPLSKRICCYAKGQTTRCRSRKVTRVPDRNTENKSESLTFYKVFQEHVGVLPAPVVRSGIIIHNLYSLKPVVSLSPGQVFL